MPTRMRRALRWTARIAGWVAVVVLSLLLGVALMVSTVPGRKALLRVALSLANARLAGHVSAQRLEGDVWRRFVLREVRLDDAEGLEAIYARRLEARVDWGALWHKRFRVVDLRVDGARVTLRHLADNRFNLAALMPPGKPEAKPAKPERKQPEDETWVMLEHVRLQLDGAYHPPRGHEAHVNEWPRGTFDIDAALLVHGGQVELTVHKLVSDARDPLQAHVELRGGLVVTPHATPAGTAELTFRDVVVTVESEGDQLARLLPTLHPRGRWSARAAGGGPLSDLHASVVVSAPAGHVAVEGWMARAWPGIRWRGTVVGSGLDVGADWNGVPPGKLDFEASGEGARNVGTWTLARLNARGEALTLTAQGRGDFAGFGRALVHASVPSLERLRTLGLPLNQLRGAARVDAELARDRRGLALDATARLTALALRKGRLRLGAAGLVARAVSRPGAPVTVNLDGSAMYVGAADVASRAQPFTVRTGSLALTMEGGPKRPRIALTADVDGMRAQALVDAALAPGALEATVRGLRLERAGKVTTFDVPLQVQLAGEPAAPRFALRAAGASVTGRVHFGHAVLAADVAADAPDLARLGRLGGVAMAGAARLSAGLRWGPTLALDVALDGEGLRLPGLQARRLHARLASVDLEGDVTLDGDALLLGQLRLDRLRGRVHGGGERLHLWLDGERHGAGGRAHLALDVDGRWHPHGLVVRDADLMVRALAFDLPGQAWQLVAPARLVVAPGRATLSELRVRSGMGELALGGQWRDGAVDATLALRDGDLAEVSRAAGRPGLLPAARWSGRVHLAGTVAHPVVEARLEARAAQTVAWYGLAFNALTLDAYADRTRFMVHADAHGRNETRIVIDAHGAPEEKDGRLSGAALTLERLRVAVHNRTWDLRGPCHVVADTRLAADDCRLGSGRAEVALRGVAPLVPDAPPALDLTLSATHLDLRDVGDLLAPGHKLPPKTDFQLAAHLTGTRAAPIVELSLKGKGSQVDEGLPENVDYRVHGHYEGGRVRGDLSMRQVGVRLGVGATFDLPVRFDPDHPEPLSLELEARPVPFFKIRDLLPTPLANLQGFFTLRLSASGTTRDPEVTAELHAPSWQLDNLHNNDTVVNLAYGGRQLVVNGVTSFQATSLLASILRIRPQRDSGAVKLELRVPVDLARLVASHAGLRAFAADAPLEASLELRAVDLTQVPLSILGLPEPFSGGRVDGSARLEGTLRRPTVHAELHARELARTGLIDHLDVDARLVWRHGRLELAGDAAVRGAPLLRAGGHAVLAERALFEPGHGRDGALAFDLTLPDYPLDRLRDLQPELHGIGGHLGGSVAVRGSWAAPTLSATLAARDFMLAGGRFGRVAARADYAAGRWQTEAHADAVDGGRLAVAASVDRDREAPLTVRAEARALDLTFAAGLWEQLAEVGGRLDGALTIDGSRAAPQPHGWLRLDGGRVGFRSDPRRYQLALALTVDGAAATLTRLELRNGAGRLDATGHARLQGLVPVALRLDAHAKSLEVGLGSAALRLDSDFSVEGDRRQGALHGALTVRRGTVQLPTLPGRDAALPTAELADVRFADARAQRDKAARSAGHGLFVATQFEGPLALRSADANVDLTGQLDVSVSGGALGLSGVLEAGGGGTVDLLGHRYTVERGLLGFDGDPSAPELHLRLTRKIGAANVAIVIEGTAQRPDVRVTCDPPVYEQAQLVSLVLAGRAGQERIALHDLHRQIAGLLSALVIQKIEQQLAPSLPIDVVRPLDQQSYAELSQSPSEVGRFVTDRIYVSYEHRFGSRMGRSAANAAEARAEYHLGGGWELDTTFGDAGVGGVYLFWTTRH